MSGEFCQDYDDGTSTDLRARLLRRKLRRPQAQVWLGQSCFRLMLCAMKGFIGPMQARGQIGNGTVVGFAGASLRGQH